MPEPEEPQSTSPSAAPDQDPSASSEQVSSAAPSEVGGVSDLEELVSELAEARSRIREGEGRIATEADALEQSGEEAVDAVEGFAQAISAGGERLESAREQAEEVLESWGHTLEAAARALGELEGDREEAGGRFDSEVDEAGQRLDERLAELSGSFEALAGALDGLAAEADALHAALEEAVSRLEQAVEATGEAADATTEEVEAKAQQAADVVGGDLGPILVDGLTGLVEDVEGQLAPSGNPVAAAEREATALLLASGDEISVLGNQAAEQAVEVLEAVAPKWESPQSSATATADETVDRKGVELFQELDRLMETLGSGVEITGAWGPVLAQLPSTRDMAERVHEAFEAMNLG